MYTVVISIIMYLYRKKTHLHTILVEGILLQNLYSYVRTGICTLRTNEV